MFQSLRRSSRLVTLLVLALAVGPTAAALCPHPGGEDMGDHGAMGAMPEMDHGAMDHGAMDHDAMGHEAPPPCHEEEPQPEPENAACDSPCCIVAPEAPVPSPPAPPVVVASAALAVAVAEAEPRAVEAPEVEPEPPPAPPLRVHLLLGQFLT